MRRSLLALCTILVLAPASARAAGLAFSPPQQLRHGNPTEHPYYSGGEPSIAFDPSGDGHVYVTTPQGIPTAANLILGASDATNGVSVWASSDHGASWPVNTLTGSLLGGGDSDVEVLPDHTVLVADLEAVSAAICTSHDFAHTFADCAGGIAANHQGPENDREWLTRGPKPGEVYLTYHDFVGGTPIIERSTDGGKTFSLCGSIVDLRGPAGRTFAPNGGTLVSKPVVTADDTIYIQFSTPDQLSLPVGQVTNHLYMAVARGGCTASTVFSNYVIYENPGADLGSIFQQAAIDSVGVLYVVASGKAVGNQTNHSTYLFTSSDGGKTWSAPIRVSNAPLEATVFPTIAAGLGRGEVAIGWLGTTTSGDPNTLTNQWRFYAAETYDGGQTFNVATVTPDVMHYGDVCTQGLFCGLIPGKPSNRNLADFASIAVDPASGCAVFAMPGDPYNRPDLPNGKDNGNSSSYISSQLDPATCLKPAVAGSAAGAVGGNAGAGPTGCVDRVPPVARLTRRTASRSRGLRLAGRASDRGCGPQGKGRVTRVQVALARRSAGRCSFARRSGRFSRPRSCRKPIYARAKGTTRWSFSFAHRLARGRYTVSWRAFDAAGNASRPRSVSFTLH